VCEAEASGLATLTGLPSLILLH